MQVHARHAVRGQLLGQLLRPVLGAGEHHGPPGGRREVTQHRELGVLVHLEHVVGHGGHRRLRGVGLVGDRVVQEPVHDHLDPPIEGGAEEQLLPVAGRRAQQALHARQEAEVGHVVGLVEDDDLRVAQVAVPLADEVLQPAGAREHDVHALAQRVHLRVLADATEDRGGRQPLGGGQRRDGTLDLQHELAGRRQDQRAGTARCGAAAVSGQAGHQGHAEGQGLARSGAAAAEHVATGQGVRQGRGLDGGGGGDSRTLQHGGQGGGHAEVGKVLGHEGTSILLEVRTSKGTGGVSRGTRLPVGGESLTQWERRGNSRRPLRGWTASPKGPRQDGAGQMSPMLRDR